MADQTYGRSDTLPPIGDIQPGSSAESKAVELIYSRRQGIVTSLTLPLQLAKKCRKIAAWGEDIDRPDESQTVVHKIRQAIETQVSSHLKEPVKITIEPVETGEYAKWYWCGPPEAANDAVAMGVPFDEMFIGAIAPPGSDPNRLAMMGNGWKKTAMGRAYIPPIPLPPPLVMQIKQLSEMCPDIISPDYICKLDDQYTAKTLQKKFDSDWKDAKGDKWLRSRVYANVIEGWQLPFYEHDPKKGHILNRNSIFQTYVAQECEDIDDAPEAGIDLYMDLNEAIAKYPQQKEAILKDASASSLNPPQTAGQVPTQYAGEFRRPMVRKVVWWIRNQPVGIKAALEAGLVEARTITPGDQSTDGGMDQSMASPANSGLGGDQIGEAARISPADPGNAGITSADGSSANAAESPADGELAGGGNDEPISAPLVVYVLANTNTEVTPDSPDWPLALHQISIIGDGVVESIVCPWPDIPIVHMRNTMVIGKPWGVGEPFYAKKLQDAYSNITDSAVRHTEYNANGAFEMHQGLKEALEAEYGRAFVDPGKIIGIPGALWKDGQPLIRAVLPPPFPQSSLEIRAALGEDFNEIAGRPDVLAGRSPSPQDSGRKIEQLTMNAVEPLNFKAQEIAYAVEKLAMLMLHAILHYQDPAQIAEQLSMPLPLLMLVLERAGKRPPNVQITISTGAGSVLERRRSQTVQYNQLISPDDGQPLISGKRTRNLIHGDADMSVRESIQSRREAMAAMPVQQEEGGEQEKGSNGNGQHSANGNGRFNHE